MNSSIRIGPIIYTIQEVEWSLSDPHGGQKLFGMTNFGTCHIQIERGDHPQQRLQTLLHEVVHIVGRHTGIDREDLADSTADALAHGLMQVLVDNRWLVYEICQAYDTADHAARQGVDNDRPPD